MSARKRVNALPFYGGSGQARWLSGGDSPNPPSTRRSRGVGSVWSGVAQLKCVSKGAKRVSATPDHTQERHHHQLHEATEGRAGLHQHGGLPSRAHVPDVLGGRDHVLVEVAAYWKG